MPDTNSSTRSREMEIYRGTAKLSDGEKPLSPIVRLCTDWGYATRVVRYAMGLPVPLDTEDRRVLEHDIFAYFLALPRTFRVLFIGCDWYTKHYQRAFFSDRDYWTLDVSRRLASSEARSTSSMARSGSRVILPRAVSI